MPRRFFRKFALKRHELAQSRLFAPLRHLFNDTRLWGISRRSVVPAFALGVFLAFLPFPGHPILAMLGALALRINVPIAAVTTLLNNPLTMGPMFYAAYRLGSYLLGEPQVALDFELSLDWLSKTFVDVWQPLVLGCVLLGTVTAVVAFLCVDLAWRVSVHDYKFRKRRQRKQR